MKILISHSSVDKEYGEKLVRFLRDIGIGSEEIIFTSNSGYGIPAGENIFKWLKYEIQEKPFVIYLISEAYYKSVACLNEMGAAWIVENEHVAVLTPNFDTSSDEFASGALDPREIYLYINKEDDIYSLINKLEHHFTIIDNRFLMSKSVRELLSSINNIEESKKKHDSLLVEYDSKSELDFKGEYKDDTDDTLPLSEIGYKFDWKDSVIIFSECMAKTFPGKRGVELFENLIAIERLKIFFENINQKGDTGDSVWWRRGGYDFPIKSSTVIDGNILLLGFHRFKVSRVFVFVSPERYYNEYIYVEAEADEPTGINPSITPEFIAANIGGKGCFEEEYGVFNNRIISREEFDDGASEYEGEIEQHYGKAELRVRCLTNVNFVITPKNSPYNNRKFRSESSRFFDDILVSDDNLDDFFKFMESFEKSDMPRL